MLLQTCAGVCNDILTITASDIMQSEIDAIPVICPTFILTIHKGKSYEEGHLTLAVAMPVGDTYRWAFSSQLQHMFDSCVPSLWSTQSLGLAPCSIFTRDANTLKTRNQ
jgi:hypothetical protein